MDDISSKISNVNINGCDNPLKIVSDYSSYADNLHSELCSLVSEVFSDLDGLDEIIFKDIVNSCVKHSSICYTKLFITDGNIYVHCLDSSDNSEKDILLSEICSLDDLLNIVDSISKSLA